MPIGNFGGGDAEGEEVKNILVEMGILKKASLTKKYRVLGKATDNKGKVRDLFSSMGFLNGYEILDYCTGVDLMKPIRGKYNLGICMDLLEHTANPFIVAENITNSLEKGALLFVTAPWVWEVHECPIDNWRFTTSGITTLFPKMEVLESRFVRDRDEPPEKLPNERVVAVFKKK